MYVFTLLSFSISRPWRKEFYTNAPFTVILILVLILSTILVVVPESRPDFMQLDMITYKPLLTYVILMAWGAGLLIYFLQKFVLEPFFNKRSLRRAQELNN